MAVVLSTLAMFYVCGEGNTVFNSDECLSTPRNIHIWTLLHTTGYFITDFFVQYFLVQGRAAIDYQTYAHHIIGAVTFYQTLYFMNYMVVFGVMLVFQEISTTYVALRWLLYKHDMGRSQAYFLNAFFMFVFFMVGRLWY